MRKLFVLLAMVILLPYGCASIMINPNEPGTHLIQGVKQVVQGSMQCGPASMTMVLNYYGIKVSLNTVDKIRGSYGTPCWAMERYPAKYSLTTRVMYSDDPEELKSYLKKDIPLIIRRICLWNPANCHYVVLIGYTSKGFIILCPKEGRYVKSYKRFKNWEPCKSVGYPWTLVIYP